MPRESLESKKNRVARIAQAFHKQYPNATCSLNYENPLQLLVATILSAQCTDAMVNKVTPKLFQKYKSAADFASAPQDDLERMIHSTGFFRNKAKNIRGACKKITEQFGGELPRTMEEMLSLPGIARKSANVILGTAFAISEGIVVDTHVTRLSNRLGLTKSQNPVIIERDLMKTVPREEWIFFAHAMVWHGRATCNARKPDCENCCVRAFCPYPPDK